MDVKMMFIRILFIHALHHLIGSIEIEINNLMYTGCPDKALDGSFLVVTVPSEITCCSLCLRTWRCQTVNFHEETGQCEMVAERPDYNSSQNGSPPVSRPGWKILFEEVTVPHTRLADGNSSSSGRIEVFHNGAWGTVCDDAFGENDATVVCRSLGFRGFTAYYYLRFGTGDGPIKMDDVGCNGTEQTLHACPHRGYNIHNCAHSEDQGIICDDRV